MNMSNTEKRVKEIRRKTRRKFSSEEKIRIVLDGLRGECSIAELRRWEGINPNLYYRWCTGFLEAGKKGLAGDIVREARLLMAIDKQDEWLFNNRGLQGKGLFSLCKKKICLK